MMFGLPNPYVLLGGAAAALALAGGAWLAYEHHGTMRYEAGKKEVSDQWRKADEITVAVGATRTAIAARDAIRNTEKTNAKLAELEKRKAVVAADNRSVRGPFAAIAAAAPASSPTLGPACRSYETEYRSCASLLGEGFELAGEGSSMALDIAERLESLQEDARTIRSVVK